MEMADADFMLQLKNDPETRRFSIVSQEEIKKEDHYKWLEENLQYFQIIQSDNAVTQDGKGNFVCYSPIGAVRIQNNEVSIWIDRMFRGNGMASYVLEMVSEVGMTAKIVEGNLASMNCFINAGFKPIKKNNNYYIFQK